MGTNARANHTTIRETSTPQYQGDSSTGQKPFAIILSCSDWRVPPEIIFDKGLGEHSSWFEWPGTFRTPLSSEVSNMPAEHFGCLLIVVLGHSRCGAVTAAVESQGNPHGNIEPAIIKTITPAVKQARQDATGAGKSDLVESAIDNNIKLVANPSSGSHR